MGFVDVLRKLGVFRSGTKTATYKNAKEKPIELMKDDVFNAEKDLINTEKKKEGNKK